MQKEPEKPDTEALLRAIAEKRKDDPMIGIKVGSTEVRQRLFRALDNDEGVHVETALAILGSLGGFACQMSVREGLAKGWRTAEKNAFMAVEATNGKKYYFGDAINEPLAEGPYSIWSFAAGAAQLMKSEELPDIQQIFQHVSSTIGTDDFGLPRYPEGHAPEGGTPASWVRHYWPALMPVAAVFCEKPEEWPILFGAAIQQAILLAEGVLEPFVAVSIVMEAAVPMSKIDPEEIFGPFSQN